MAAIFVAGCVTSKPDPTTGAPVYSTDTESISNRVAMLHGIVNSVPANPYSGAANTAIDLGAGIVALVSGLFAVVKNKQANKAKAVSRTLARGITQAGASGTALAVATGTDHVADVAQHLSDATLVSLGTVQPQNKTT